MAAFWVLCSEDEVTRYGGFGEDTHTSLRMPTVGNLLTNPQPLAWGAKGIGHSRLADAVTCADVLGLG